MAVSKLPRPGRIPLNRISGEKPPEGRARTPRYPQVSRRRGGMVARQRRGEKEQGESGGKAQSWERAVARHRVGREQWQGTERWEGVGFYKARRTPRAKTSARSAAFSRARAILSRCLCYLYSLLYCYIYFIFYIYLYFSTLYSFFSLKNRVGDDGVPAILQYRPSYLYLTDRKGTMAMLQKDTHTPLQICK